MTPVGRLVQGHPLELQHKNKAGQPYVKRGTQELQPKMFFALAFPKTQAAWWFEPDPMWAGIYNAGRSGYPQNFDPRTGACNHPRFAWKVMDGDGVDDDGKPNNQKPGMAGHWILKFGGIYLPKVIHNGQYVTDPNVVKRGYFLRVSGNAEANIGSDKPGLYMNANGVELVAYGEEIKSGPDVVGMFAAAGAAQLPPGATMVPPTPSGTGGLPIPGQGPAMQPPPGLPGQGVPAMPMPAMQPPPMAAAPAMPMPTAPGAMMPPPGVVPNHGFVNAVMTPPPQLGVAPGGLQPPPLAAPPVVQQPQFQMTAAAQGYTREQYLAQGHTDDALITAGYMVRIG